MASIQDAWFMGMGFASIVEHLMFAVVPAGLVGMTTARGRTGSSQPPRHFQDTGSLIRAFLPTAIAMLAIQFRAAGMWLGASFGSNASFPAAVLSILASLSVCIVLRSDLATEFRPAKHPLFLLGVTAFYDATASWHCFTLSHWHLSRLQLTIALLKLGLVVLVSVACRLRPLKEQDHEIEALTLFQNVALLLKPLSVYIQEFLTRDLSRVGVIGDPGALSEQFLRYWKSEDQERISISKACTHVLYWQHVSFVVLRFCYVVLDCAQPFHLHHTISLVQEKNASSAQIRTVFIYTIILHLGITLMHGITASLQTRILASTRSMLVATVHAKSLKLSSETLAATSLGSIISNDVEDVVGGVRGSHGLFQRAYGIVLAAASLYYFMGYASVSVVFTVLLISALSSRIARHDLPALKVCQEKVASRQKATASAIAQLKNIKMMGLSDVLTDYLERQVSEEVKAVFRHFRHRCLSFSLASFVFTLSPVIVLGTGWYLTESLTAIPAAHILAIYLVTGYVTKYLTTYEFFYSEIKRRRPAMASLERFLLLGELEKNNAVKSEEQDTDLSHTGTAINAVELTDVTIASAEGEIILQDVSLEISRNAVAMICGSVGCGKSSLLRAILGEINPTAGLVMTASSLIAYCAQNPWFPACTIRQIIVNGQYYVAERYRAVLIACCLDTDLLHWPDGDLTSVNTAGFMFTRSLKQRIALARALYVQSSIIILDDALSSIGSSTLDSITRNLFGPSGLIYTWDCTVIMATNNQNQLRFADVIFQISEDHEIWEHRDIVSFLRSSPPHMEIESDVFEPTYQRNLSNAVAISDLCAPASDGKNKFISIPEMYNGITYLFRHAGLIILCWWIIGNYVMIVLQELPPVFLAARFNGNSFSAAEFTCFALIGILAVICIGITPLIFFNKIASRTAETLYSKLIRTAMRATPEFICTVDLSYLLKLFEDDFRVVSNDIHLPFMQFSYMSLAAMNSLLIISSAVRYGFLLVLAYIVLSCAMHPAYLVAQKSIRDSSRNAKVALDVHLAETELGLEHIRAFGQTKRITQEARKLISLSQHYDYCESQSTSRLETIGCLWTAFLNCTMIALALVFQDITSAAALGVALVFAQDHGSKACNLIRARDKVHRYLDSVSRIQNFCETTPLETDEPTALPPVGDWPPAGELEFHNATVTAESAELIAGHSMTNVNVYAEAGEKIGLAGHPDHGQSSVILAVLRMVDHTGNITIDGQDIKSIPRDLLRSKITTITQDGIAISGSVRLNLDPFSITEDRFTNTELVSMLTRVGLWHIVKSRGGLDADISRMKFSLGHLQLLNLARGALHKRRAATRIVLIDEATSTLDVDSEFQMSDFMDGEFAGATVLIVAHRLQCFETADVVLMMREGRVDSILRQDEDTGEWYEDFGGDDDDVRPV